MVYAAEIEKWSWQEGASAEWHDTQLPHQREEYNEYIPAKFHWVEGAHAAQLDVEEARENEDGEGGGAGRHEIEEGSEARGGADH
eukprot:scaffold6711_cov118-Isochrysis_galbana.AAC.13